MNIRVDSAIPKLKINLTGQWTEADRLPTEVVRILQRASNQSSEQFSQQILQIVRTAISTGTPPAGGGVNWPGLSDATIRRWGATTLYNLHGEMLRALVIVGEGTRRQIGLRNLTHSYGAHLSMSRVSKILEFGTAFGIPRRPLWEPTLKAVGGSAGIAHLTIQNIQKGLRAKYGKGAKVGI
jgi:hypothetical protein